MTSEHFLINLINLMKFLGSNFYLCSSHLNFHMLIVKGHPHNPGRNTIGTRSGDPHMHYDYFIILIVSGCMPQKVGLWTFFRKNARFADLEYFPPGSSLSNSSVRRNSHDLDPPFRLWLIFERINTTRSPDINYILRQGVVIARIQIV